MMVWKNLGKDGGDEKEMRKLGVNNLIYDDKSDEEEDKALIVVYDWLHI
jgi:hypothetical protein